MVCVCVSVFSKHKVPKKVNGPEVVDRSYVFIFPEKYFQNSNNNKHIANIRSEQQPPNNIGYRIYDIDVCHCPGNRL